MKQILTLILLILTVWVMGQKQQAFTLDTAHLEMQQSSNLGGLLDYRLLATGGF